MCRLRNTALENVTDGRTDRQTDGQTDRRRPKLSLCVAMLRHKCRYASTQKRGLDE